MIIPIVLAVDVKEQLWPASSIVYPDFLLNTKVNFSMLQNAVLSTRAIRDIATPLIFANYQYRFLIQDHLKEVDINNVDLFLGNFPRDTAPIIALAALLNQRKDPLLLILPVNHFIRDFKNFTLMIERAVPLVLQGNIVTFGEKMKRSKNEFSDSQATENPSNYIKSGIYLMKASCYLQELVCHAPVVVECCEKALLHTTHYDTCMYLNLFIYSNCPALSIEDAVLNKIKNTFMMIMNSD